METEKCLDKFKKDYLSVQLPAGFENEGWLTLRETLGERQNYLVLPLFKSFIFTAVFILVLGGILAGLTQVSQTALPGEPLYQVKRLTENLVAMATGNDQVKLEHRAEEIIDLSQDIEEHAIHLEETVKEYEKTVVQTRQEVLNEPEKREDFESSLIRQEEKFEEVIKSGTSNESLMEAVEISRRGHGGGDDDNEIEDEDRSGSNSGSN